MNTSIKQSAVMSAGTIINSLLGLAFYILIARFLGPSNFGNFSYLLGFGLLAAEVGDLGLGSALVRFGSGSELRGVFTITFGQRIGASAIFFLLALLGSFVATGNFYLSALAATSLQFLSLITQTFLARQKYGFYVSTNIFGNLVRLSLIWLFWSSNSLGVESTLLSFAGANIIAFVLGLVLILTILKKIPVSISEARNVFPAVWSYARWVALSFGVASIGAKIDVPIVYALAGSTVTGIYSSAQKLISVFSQIAASIEGVFAPKFSAQTENRSFFKEYVTIAILISSGLLILPVFSGVFINLVFGAKYVSSIPVFNLMAIALIPFFLAGPFSASVLYRFGKSNYHLAISLGQLAIGLLGYWFFVPLLGAMGAAVTTLLVNLFGLLVYIKIYQRLK